jgi:hypothetical protein
MLLQIVISQVSVWVAILTERFAFYFYEELGWVFLFVANTIATAYLYLTADTLAGREVLLELNLAFGGSVPVLRGVQPPQGRIWSEPAVSIAPRSTSRSRNRG